VEALVKKNEHDDYDSESSRMTIDVCSKSISDIGMCKENQIAYINSKTPPIDLPVPNAEEKVRRLVLITNETRSKARY
jgi:hypothetical protein